MNCGDDESASRANDRDAAGTRAQFGAGREAGTENSTPPSFPSTRLGTGDDLDVGIGIVRDDDVMDFGDDGSLYLLTSSLIDEDDFVTALSPREAPRALRAHRAAVTARSLSL